MSTISPNQIEFESYQTMQVMQTFNVDRKPTAIFFADLDLVASQS